MLKKRKCILPMFRNIIQIVKKVILLMIPNGGWYYLAVKKLSASRGIKSKHVVIFTD